MMFRIALLVTILFFGLSSVFAADDCYISITDRTGTVDTTRIVPLHDASCAIREILPAEIKNKFVVFEEGQYYPSAYFEQINDSLEMTQFRELSAQHSAFFYISRRINILGQTRFKAWLKLPESEEYGCINSGLMFVIAEQVTARMNESEGVDYVEQEEAGLELLKEELDKSYNCCFQPGGESATYCSTCAFSQEATLDNRAGFVALEQKVLDITYGGRFLKLENLMGIEVTRTVGADPIAVDIIAKWKTLPGGMVLENPVVRLTDDLKALRSLGGDQVKVRAMLFDHTNCSALQNTLATWSQAGFELENAFYGEEIIVIKLGGEIGIYSRLRSQSPTIADYCEEDDFENFNNISNTTNAKVILPVALVVREILKRALMGAINVFIDVSLGVTVEKVFHQVSDSCEVNTWGAAWNRYQRTVSGWQLFFTFVDGAANNAAFSVLAGGLEEATRYLLDPSSGASFNKGSPEFSVSKLFKKIVEGCATALLSDIAVDLAKHAKKAVKKMRGSNLPSSTLNELTGEVNTLLGFFFKEGFGGVKTWILAYNRGISSIWRRSPRFLRSLRKVKNDSNLNEHIRKGHPTRRSDGSISGIKGVHHKSASTVTMNQSSFSQGDVRIKPGSKNPPNAGIDDIYEAKPEIYGLNKSETPHTQEWRRKIGGGGKSTFFPDSWTESKIQNEIALIRAKVTLADYDNINGWYSTWNSDKSFKIAIYLDDLNDVSSRIGSAFPLFP